MKRDICINIIIIIILHQIALLFSSSDSVLCEKKLELQDLEAFKDQSKSFFHWKTFQLKTLIVFQECLRHFEEDRGVWNKTEGSNTITSTSFALKFGSNKITDVDIIVSITLTVS